MQEKRVLEPGPPLLLHCQVCQHEWDFPWEKGMNLAALAARAEGYGVCPSCGNKSKARKKAILIVPQKEECHHAER